MIIPEKIYEIAVIIERDWKKVNYAAVPYLQAMHSLQTIDDTYANENASSIITYFLSNATTWRGEVAKAVKKKLKSMTQ